MYDSVNGIDTNFHGFKRAKKGFIFFGQIPTKTAHCGTEPACRLIPLVSYAVAVWPKPLQHYTTVQRLLYTVCSTLVYTVHKQHTVSRLQIPLDRRTVKSIFHCSKQGSAAENSTVVEGKQLPFICSVCSSYSK